MDDSTHDERATADAPDAVFRISLDPPARPVTSLEEFYRGMLEDLLQVVRLYSKGQPVIVDSFAFLGRPDRRVPILREGDQDRHDRRPAPQDSSD
jgi:hypothetical protein